MNNKLMVVFGTRPEAIKMCPLVRELYSRKRFDTKVCVTGQHRSMLDQVLDIFDVKPDHDLNIMKENQTLADITNAVIVNITPVLIKERPAMVLVHGDTTTSFASALAAFYLQIPVGHVEAGLRTYDLAAPFPEEFNRHATGIIAKLNFAPTELAAQNLLAERISGEKIFVTGNTVIDAMRYTVRSGYTHPVLDWAEGSRLILITAHRRENLGRPMHDMFCSIRRIIDTFEDVKAVYPIHLNPAVRRIAAEHFEGCERIKLIEPLDAVDFHNFIAASTLVLTDSGGVQEEAPSLGKPVLVMRDTTERPEGVEAGTLKLVGTNEERIFDECSRLLNDPEAYAAMSRASNPYGDGHACERIADLLENELLNS